MVDGQVKKAWEACFRQENGLGEDLIVRKRKIDRRNRMNYNLMETRVELTRGDGRLLGQSSFVSLVNRVSLVSLVRAVERSLHDRKH